MPECVFTAGEPCGDGRAWASCSQCGTGFCARAEHIPKIKAVCEPKPPGLGDMVAAGLEAVGITKDRVQAIASAVGIKDCGCPKRQAFLNSAGRKLGIGRGG